MSNPKTVPWRIAGEEVASCNCAWGCPCQFNASPTQGKCETLIGWQIREGRFDTIQLDGLQFAQIVSWPGPIHEGNGTRQIIIDAQASPDQRDALITITSGTQGGIYFEIFSAVCPTLLDPVVAPITFQSDRTRRQALLRIAGIGESHVEPITNPETGEEFKARIVLPEGFEYQEAEMANTASLKVESGKRFVFEHQNSYGQLNAFDWSNR